MAFIVYTKVNGHSTYHQNNILGGYHMPRVYSNYSQQELLLLQQESAKMGLTVSSYQKYRTLKALNNNNTFNMPTLISTMKETLAQKKKGDVFIVSALLPDEWVSLTRSQKTTLAKALKGIVDENPKKYAINAVLPGKINQYIVL